jgi:hypothetical protein
VLVVGCLQVIDKVVGGEHMHRIPEGHTIAVPSLMESEPPRDDDGKIL